MVEIHWSELKKDVTFNNIFRTIKLCFIIGFIFWTLKGLSGSSDFWTESTGMTWIAGYVFSQLMIEFARV